MRDLESYVRSLPQAFTSQNFENIYDSLASSLEDGHVQTSTPSADQPPLSESASPEMGLNSNRHEAHEYGNLGSSENSSDSLLIPKSDKVLKSLSPPVSNVHTSEQQTPDSLHRMSQPTPLETYITEEEEGEEQKQEATEEKNKNFMALKAELAHLYSFILESSTDALSSDNLIDSSKFKKSDRSRLDHEGSMSPDLFDTLHHSKAVLPDDAGSSNHSPNFSSVCAYDSSQLADEAVSQLTNTSLPHMSCKNADSKKSTNSLQHPTEALTKEQSLCSDTTNSCVRKRRSATQRVSSTHSSYAVDFSSLEPQKLSRSYKIPKKKLKVDPKMSLELHSTPYVSDEIGRIPPKTNETSSVDEKNILPVLTNTKRRESKQSSECTNSEQSWSSDTVNSSLPKQRSNSGVLPSLPSCVPDSNSQKSRKIHGKYKIPKKKLSVDPEISSVNQSSSCANVGRRTSKNQKSETINSVQQDVFTFSFKDELHESQSCAPKSNVKSPSRSYSTARQSQYRSHTLDEFNSTPILNKSSHSPPVFSAMNNSIMGNYDNFLCNKELKFNMKSKNQSFTSEDMDQNRFDTDEALQQNVSLANNDWDDNGALNSQLDDVWDNFNDDCIGYDPFSPAMTPYVNKQMLLKAV